MTISEQKGACNMKNTVIFDLDGLLVDSEIVAYQLYCDLAEKYNQHVTMEEYIHNYSGRTERSNMQTFIGLHHLDLSIEDAISFVFAKEKEYLQKGVALKPGAEELLAYLQERKYKILLASSSTRERAEDLLRQNGVEQYFDHLVFGVEVERGKPEPDIFIKACEYAQEPPQNCLVLEDSEAGIQAAYAAGIDVVCIPDMKMPGEKFRGMAAAELSSLAEVIGWLESLG